MDPRPTWSRAARRMTTRRTSDAKTHEEIAEAARPAATAVRRRLRRDLVPGRVRRSRSHRRSRARLPRGSGRLRDPDLGVAGGVTFGPIARSMLAHASPEFLERHIPKVLSGEEIWCQFYSEPEAGSDLAGIRTRATRDGDNWVLSGSKIWSSGAYYADWAMCLARTDWDVPKHRGLTWFAVPTDADGPHGPPDHADQRQRRVLRGVPRRCGRHRRRHHRRGQPRLGRHPDDARVRARRRGVGRVHARAARAGARPGRPGPHASAAPTIPSPGKPSPGPTSTTSPSSTSGGGSPRACGPRPRPTPPSPPTASWRRARSPRYGPASRWRSAVARRWPGRRTTTTADAAGDQLPQRATDRRSPPGRNEMQRNGIGERVLGLPREPSFDSTKPFNEVLRSARNWSGRSD